MGLDAFEEFDEIEISGAESQPQAGEAQSAGSQSAGSQLTGSQAVDALDEDLFNFPSPDLSHVEPVAAAESAAPTVSEPAPAAAAPAPVPDPVSTPVSAPDSAPAPALPSVAAAPAGMSDLDEDLFQFPDVFSGALLATPLEDDVHVPVQAEAFVVDELEPDLEEEVPQPQVRAQAAPVPAPEPQHTPEPQATPSTPAPAARVPGPAPTPARSSRSEAHPPAAPDYEPAPQFQGYQPYLPPTEEELEPIAAPAGARSHLTEILAVGFLVLNVALVLFAYQANASFHDTLTEVTRSVADTLTNNRASAQEPPPTITFPMPPVTQDPGNQLPTESMGLELQSMALARRMIEEERYLDARRVLYRLLANRDLAVLEKSFMAEAEFLIAESYELQGKALAEVQR